MVEAVPAWKSEDGSLHHSELNARMHDLAGMERIVFGDTASAHERFYAAVESARSGGVVTFVEASITTLSSFFLELRAGHYPPPVVVREEEPQTELHLHDSED